MSQLSFVRVPDAERGKKTRVFLVASASSGLPLGSVKWYAPWRRYVFYPRPHTLFDPECLNEISVHAGSETLEHKRTAKKP